MTKNTLIIIMDSLRFKTSEDSQDAIEELVRNYGGRKYTRAMAPSIWSLPSHVSILTGLDAYEHGVTTNKDALSKDADTVLDDLDKKTAVFGSNPYLHNGDYGIKQHFDDSNTSESELFSDSYVEHLRNTLFQSSTDEVTTSILNWIDNQESSWFVFLNIMETHAPYIPEKIGISPSTYYRMLNPDNIQYNNGFKKSDSRLKIMNNLYNKCAESVGKRISHFVHQLDELGELQNTHIIITSDHGDGFGEPNITDGSKSVFHYDSLNSELLHIPLYEIKPSVPSFELNNRLASLKELPNSLRGDNESFNTDICTSSVLFGGNMNSLDEYYFDSWGKCRFEQGSDDIKKYVSDVRGIWSTEEISTEEIENKIDEEFDKEPGQKLAKSSDISDDVESRLSDLGYK